MLDAGADPNKSNKYGETPLFHAIKNKNSKLTLLLVQRGAKTEIVSSTSSKSALELLRENGDIKTMSLLTDYLT